MCTQPKIVARSLHIRQLFRKHQNFLNSDENLFRWDKYFASY
jgi:hypothetical protein